MPSVKDKAKEYVAKAKVNNISELESIDTALAVFEEQNTEFPYSYIEVDGIRYKVPVSVLASLNAILEDKPDLRRFKVKKSGEGMDTRYTVIPLE